MGKWKLKPEEIEVPIRDPFANDLFRRKRPAELLSKLLMNSEDPLVICIDGRYGDGKSTFLKMWRQHLENKGCRTVLFNAWENDFSDDPLVSLIGELDSQLKELIASGGVGEDISKKLEDMKTIGARLARRSLPILVSAVANKLGIDGEMQQLLTCAIDEVTKEAIDDYEEGRRSIDKFKQNIEEIASSIAGMTHGGVSGLPLVIMIDELDRCRPPFSIGVLEKVKHLFSVKNVMFVLAVDRIRLSSAISVIYGDDTSDEGYLRRFIDFDYSLKSYTDTFSITRLMASISTFEQDVQRTFEQNVQRNEQSQHFVQEHLRFYFTGFGLTLRQQRIVITRLQVVLALGAKDIVEYLELVTILLLFQIKYCRFYTAAYEGRLMPDDVVLTMRATDCGKSFEETCSGKRFHVLKYFWVNSEDRDRKFNLLESESDRWSDKIMATGRVKTDREQSFDDMARGAYLRYNRYRNREFKFLDDIRGLVDATYEFEAN